jgi:hypothetical protein
MSVAVATPVARAGADRSELDVSAGQAPWYRDPSVAVAVLLVVGWMLLRGRDANNDQLSSHINQLHWFFERRGTTDLPLGSWIGQFLPALWAAPWYFAIRHLPPIAGNLVLGSYGIAFLLVVRSLWAELASALLEPRWRRPIPTAVVVFVAGTSSAVLTELGTTMGNVTTGIFVLLGLKYAVRAVSTPTRPMGSEEASADRVPRLRSFGLAGLHMGIATGFKWTNAIFALSAGVALAICATGSVKVRTRQILVFALMSSAGMALSGGPGMLVYQRRYGNPFFPFFNGIFKSPWWTQTNVNDPTYVLRSIRDLTIYPLAYAMASTREATPVRDVRLFLGVVLAVGVLVLAARHVRVRVRVRVRAQRSLVLLSIWWMASYMLWGRLFGVHRYAAVLEVVAVLIAFVVVARASSTRASMTGVLGRSAGCAFAVFTVVFTLPADHTHTKWRTPWLVPPITLPAHSQVLFDEAIRLTSISPSLPADAQRVGVVGLTQGGRRMKDAVRAALSTQHGPRYFVYRGPNVSEHGQAVLDTYRWRLAEQCQTYTTSIEIKVCELLPA